MNSMKAMVLMGLVILGAAASSARAEMAYHETLRGKVQLVNSASGEVMGVFDFKPYRDSDSEGELTFKGNLGYKGRDRLVDCWATYEVGNRKWLMKPFMDVEWHCNNWIKSGWIDMTPEIKSPTGEGTTRVKLDSGVEAELRK